MKVCHMTSVHPYDDIRITIKEAQSLAKVGYEVHLIAPNTKEKKFGDVYIHGLMNNYKSRIQRVKKFTKDVYLKALEIDANIYHFHDPELLPIGEKLKREGKVVIYDVHEDVPRQILNKHWIPKMLRKPFSYAFEMYENNKVRKMDAIVTATPHIKKRFENLNGRVVNINNFPILNELYKPEEKKNVEKKMLYIGGITEERGSIAMVRAIEETQGTLEIAGNFVNQEEKIKFKEAIKIETKVNYHGYLDRDGIRKMLSKSSAGFVILEPRLNFIDSLPIKMFEYMAAGIPVIASNFPLWQEIIEKNNCGICVNPLNIEEIKNAVEWIFKNPIEAAMMGNNGRNAVENKYNWETESKELIKLYKSIY
ncbi:glycosyltransferase family 4 protein [Oceanobacillus sp. CAU 1775]